MASNTKEVKVKVATEEELSGVEALELRIDRLNKQRIQLHIDTQTEELNKASSRIEEIKRTIAGLEAVPAHLGIDIDEQEINKLKGELAQLEQQSLDLQLSIETSELKKAKADVEELDNEEIEIQLRSQSAMEAIDQMGQGFDRLKQGASEVGQRMGEVLESAGRMEQTETFLSMNLGADVAKKKLEEIRSVTDQLPGDDVTLQNLLSQAALKDANMTTEAFTQMGSAAADYMAAMQNFGKTSTETQQDLMNYILAGNTAEIERSPILQSHIDKLKEATTVQERSKALQEALNQEGWGGIASQDIYNNKMQQFNDMLERGKMNLGDMFLHGSEGAMDFLINLDSATGGLVGMVSALGGFAAPITDTIMGLGQMATGIKAMKDLGLVKYLKESAAAQWLLNAAEAANPIGIVIMAIAALIAILAYLYFNNEQVRAAIDGLGQSLMMFGQWIYNGAIYWLQQLQTTLMNLWNYIVTLGGLLPANVQITGNQILDTILRVLAFIATLPMRVGMIFIDIIAKALGFGNNFSQRMLTAAWNAVTNFGNAIAQIPSRLGTELGNALNKVNEWAATLPQKFWDAGVNAVKNFLNALGIHSPGTMQRMLVWEIQEMGKRIPEEAKTLLSNVARLGSDVIDNFGDPTLGLSYDDTMNSQLEANAITGNQQGITVIFNHYGDIDNEDRQNKVVDAVIRALSFENDTAGRTV